MAPLIGSKIVECQLDAIVALKEQLEQLSFRPTQSGLVYTAQSIEDAQLLIEQHQIPCLLMGIESGDKQKEAFEFLKTNLNKPFFKGAMIFSEQSHRLDDWQQELPIKADQKVFCRPKINRLAKNFQAAANFMMEDIWEIIREQEV